MIVDRLLIGGIFIGTLSMTAPVARASVIFNNFGAGLSYDTTGGNPIGNAFDGNNYAEGDTFSPAISARLSSLSLALSCAVGCPASENFTVALTTDGGDQPGSVLESFLFSGMVLNALGNKNTPVVATSVLKPLLTAGTRYWISASSSLSYSLTWNWNSTGDSADQAISTDGGVTWFSPSGLTPGAFQVVVVPEPGAGLTIGGGLLMLVLRKRLRVLR
jgi:hypothetical protein